MSSTASNQDEQAPGFRARFAAAWHAFGETLADPDLRRAQLAFAGILVAQWGFTVALSVVAFREGGAAAVGLVAALCIAPATVLVPMSSALADRFPRERILIAAAVTAALTIGAAAVAVGMGAPLALICVPAVLAMAALSAVRPAHSALLPALCRTPRQLTSATVVRGMMDSIGTLCGPALAAAGLALASAEAVFALVALVALGSAAQFARVRYEAPPRGEVARRRLAREITDGFALVARDRDVGVIIGIAAVQTLTRGCFSVLVVVMSISLLHTGEAGVGLLTTAVGAGAVVGSLVAVLLSDSRALARWEGVGVALWGLPLVACAAFPSQPAVFVFLAAIGIGNALVDVGLFAVPSRLVPEELVGRMYGSFEALGALSVALGSLMAPLLIHGLGIRGALFAAGAVGPLCVVAAWAHLGRIDRAMRQRDEEIGLLRQVPMLQPLGLPTIERIASRVESTVVGAGAPVFEERDEGDRFYVIESGTAEVRRDGRRVRDLAPGDAFGEIALIRSGPRTATVRASGELHLRSVRRDDFLLAVNGYRAAAAEADARVLALLEEDAQRA